MCLSTLAWSGLATKNLIKKKWLLMRNYSMRLVFWKSCWMLCLWVCLTSCERTTKITFFDTLSSRHIIPNKRHFFQSPELASAKAIANNEENWFFQTKIFFSSFFWQHFWYGNIWCTWLEIEKNILFFYKNIHFFKKNTRNKRNHIHVLKTCI